MRFTACVGLAVCAAFGQSSAPPGLVRGNLLEWDAAKGAGELSIRTAAHQVYRFTFDPKTYFERDSERCAVDKLQKGDWLEVVSDGANPEALTYARTVHVVERHPAPRRPPSLGRYRAYRGTWAPAWERPLPAGNLTLSGVVALVSAGRLVLRTRRSGDQAVLVTDETRYLSGGLEVPGSELKAGTRVFVRGAKNFEDRMEAYQVVWGEILEPGP